MTILDIATLESTPLVSEPFKFVVVPKFIFPAAFDEIVADFPSVPGAGSFPPETLSIGPGLQPLLDALHAPGFEQAMERKFDISLGGRPKMLTIRGHARAKDGAIHTDTASKLISVLLYMNKDWCEDTGRLRLLRSRRLDDIAVEIPPVAGTLVAFQRSERSWHGHLPYSGARRVIQFHWMTGSKAATHERFRHLISARVKTLAGFFS
jgi:hypothetical protein